MKDLVLFSTLSLAVSFCLTVPVACARKATQACVLTSEDYAVYSATLLDVGKLAGAEDKTDLIISEQTSSPEDYNPPMAWEARPPIKQASDETVIRFKLRQKCSFHLKPQLDRAIPYRLLVTRDLVKIFGKGGGSWAEFYKEYPKSNGIVGLSPVGYNAGGTEALVYVANNCGGLCGGGYLVLLAQENGRWLVKEHVMVWVS